MQFEQGSADWFREQADRCLRLATSVSDEVTAERLRNIAAEYSRKAAWLETDQAPGGPQ